MRTRRLGGIAVVLATGVALALTGCAPAVHSQAVGDGSAAPTATPTATRSAQPQPAAPVSLFGGDCSELLPLSAVQSDIGSTSVASSTQPLDGLYQLPVPQLGGIDCAWQNPSGAIGFGVSVLPNATATIRAAESALDVSDDSKDADHQANVPRWGDESWTHCLGSGDDPPEGCTFDFRVGTFWVEVDQEFGDVSHPYPESAGIRDLLTRLVKEVRALPPVKAWKPNTDTLTFPTNCASALPLATVRSVTDSPPVTSNDASGDFGPFLQGAFAQSGSRYCSWDWRSSDEHTVYSITLTMVPGSAWAWGTSSPPAHASDYPLAAEPGLGTAAFGGCLDRNDCDLFVLANHTWFELKEGFSAGHIATVGELTSLAHTYLTTIGFAG